MSPRGHNATRVVALAPARKTLRERGWPIDSSVYAAFPRDPQQALNCACKGSINAPIAANADFFALLAGVTFAVRLRFDDLRPIGKNSPRYEKGSHRQ